MATLILPGGAAAPTEDAQLSVSEQATRLVQDAAIQISDIATTVRALFPIKDDEKNPAVHALMARIVSLSNCISIALDAPADGDIEPQQRIVRYEHMAANHG